MSQQNDGPVEQQPRRKLPLNRLICSHILNPFIHHLHQDSVQGKGYGWGRQMGVPRRTYSFPCATVHPRAWGNGTSYHAQRRQESKGGPENWGTAGRWWGEELGKRTLQQPSHTYANWKTGRRWIQTSEGREDKYENPKLSRRRCSHLSLVHPKSAFSTQQEETT